MNDNEKPNSFGNTARTFNLAVPENVAAELYALGFRVREETIGEVLDDKTRKVYIMGYSLAGLFSLWALLESNLFEGAICASRALASM